MFLKLLPLFNKNDIIRKLIMRMIRKSIMRMEIFTLKTKHKRLASGIFMLIIIALTVIALFRGHDISDILYAMSNADAGYIVLAVTAVIVFLFGQGFILRFLFFVLKQGTSILKCIAYSFKGYFFCSVTPFAIGGPPAQIVYMIRDNIPASIASMVVLITATVYKFILIIIGFGLIIFGQSFIAEYVGSSVVIMGIGLFLTCGFCFILFMFMFHPRLAKKAIFKFLRLLERKHLMKHKDGREEAIEMGMARYTQTADFFRTHPATMIVLVLLTAAQRFCLFFVTYCVYRALGLSGVPMMRIILIQAVISISVDMLPIPGGVGVTEALFSKLFVSVFSAATMLPAITLSRGISYYVQLFFCAGFIIISKYVFRGRRKVQSGAET